MSTDGGGAITTEEIQAIREVARPLGELTEDRVREFLDVMVARGAAIDRLLEYIAAHPERLSRPKRLREPMKVISNAAVELLRANGQPMHYREIYRQLVFRKVYVSGRDPAKNVGAHLSADPRFENVGRGLWALKSWGRSRLGETIEDGRVQRELCAVSEAQVRRLADWHRREAREEEGDGPARSS